MFIIGLAQFRGMPFAEVERVSLVMRLAFAAALAASVVASAPAARADDVDKARQAYDRGVDEFKRGAYRDAAIELARADDLAPNPVSLVAALRAATLADDPAFAMQLVERAEARPGNNDLDDEARGVRARFATRAGRIVPRCPTATACSLRVDGSPANPGEPRWLAAGDHEIQVQDAAGVRPYTVRLAGGERVDWRPPAAPPPSATPPASPSPKTKDQSSGRSGAGLRTLSPAWFFVGAGATVLLGGATTWSGVDTLDKYDAWLKGDDSAESAGRSAQLRTNVLVGVTGAALVATALVGVLFTDWRGKRAVRSNASWIGAPARPAIAPR